MNAQDRNRIAQVRRDANALMDGKGNGITTSDVVECLLGDLSLIAMGRAPHNVADLVALDADRSQN
jgi:hypothetical protein